MESNKGIIITKTPFRMSFFGGGTDLPIFFSKNKGSIIGTTIDKYLYVILNKLERLLEKKIRLSYSQLENVDLVEEIQHEIVKAVLSDRAFLKNGGFIDLHTFADLPASSGMGSSSSFTVGLLNAIYELNSVTRSKYELASEAIHIEREKIKAEGGWQDQIHASFGGFNRIDFKNDEFSVTPIDLPTSYLTALEESCILVFTGKLRSSPEVQRNILKSFNYETEKHLTKLNEITEKAFSALSNLTTPEKTVEKIGLLLNESWHQKKIISGKASNSEIDNLYNLGMSAGAYGGKILGAGSGGFMLFITSKEKRESVKHAMTNFKIIDFKFENIGSQVVYKQLT